MQYQTGPYTIHVVHSKQKVMCKRAVHVVAIPHMSDAYQIMIKSMLGWKIFSILSNTKVPLSHNSCFVPHCFQRFSYSGLIQRKTLLLVVYVYSSKYVPCVTTRRTLVTMIFTSNRHSTKHARIDSTSNLVAPSHQSSSGRATHGASGVKLFE